MNHPLPDDEVRLLERSVQIAVGQRPGESDVGAHVRVGQGRILRKRRLRIAHDRQRVVIHFDQIERVGCDVAVRGDDHGHRMSDEVDTILGQDGVRGHAQPGQ